MKEPTPRWRKGLLLLVMLTMLPIMSTFLAQRDGRSIHSPRAREPPATYAGGDPLLESPVVEPVASAGDIADLRTQPVNPWTRTASRSIIAAPTFNVIATNGSATYGYSNGRLCKYNESGGLEWIISTSILHDVAATIDGLVITLKYGNNATLRKLYGDGTVAWSRSFNMTVPYTYSEGKKILVDSNGDIFWFGYQCSSTGTRHPFAERYDGAGNLAWNRNEPSPGTGLTIYDAVESGDALYYTGDWSGHLAVGKLWKNGTTAWAQNVTGRIYSTASIAETNGSVFVFSGALNAPAVMYNFAANGTIVSSHSYSGSLSGVLVGGLAGVNGTLVALYFEVIIGLYWVHSWLAGFTLSCSRLWGISLDYNGEDDAFFEYLIGDLALGPGGEIAVSYYMEDDDLGIASYRSRMFLPNIAPTLEILPGRRTFLDTEDIVLDVIVTDATLDEGLYNLHVGAIGGTQAVTSGVPESLILNRMYFTLGMNSFLVTASDGYRSSEFVRVNITIENTPPSVSCMNISYEYSTTGHNLTIWLSDINYINPWYELFIDEQVHIANASYIPHSSNNRVNVDGLTLGIHNATITMHDGYGGVGVQNVTITVFNKAPEKCYSTIMQDSDHLPSAWLYVTFEDLSVVDVTCQVSISGREIFRGIVNETWDFYHFGYYYGDYTPMAGHTDQVWYKIHLEGLESGQFIVSIVLNDGLINGTTSLVDYMSIIIPRSGIDSATLSALLLFANYAILIGIPTLVILGIRAVRRNRHKGKTLAGMATRGL